MDIIFSDDAKASGDAEVSLLGKLVGFCFEVKTNDLETFEGQLVSAATASNTVTFVEWNDATLTFDGPRHVVIVSDIAKLTYL